MAQKSVMNVETIREYALAKENTEETMPFDDSTLVLKADGKMFLLISLDAQPLRFNVKCEPEKAMELRETYPDAVLPGYHMSKKHWNTVVIDGSLSAKLIQSFIDDSYNLVVKKKK